LKKIFKNTETPFVWIPRKESFQRYKAMYKAMFKALGVRLLSESVTMELAGAGNSPYPLKSPRFLTPSTIRLILCLLKDRFSQVYEKTKPNDRLQALCRTREFELNELRLSVQLPHGASAESTDATAFWDVERKSLFISKEADSHDVAEAIARKLTRKFRVLEDPVAGFLCADETSKNKHFKKREWKVPEEFESLLDPQVEADEEEDSVPNPPDATEPTVESETAPQQPPSPTEGRTAGGAGIKGSPTGRDYTGRESTRKRPRVGKRPKAEPDPSPGSDLDYSEELKISFNRPPRPGGHITDPGPTHATSKTPAQFADRTRKIREQIEEDRRNEPSPTERHKQVLRRVWAARDDDVRVFLREQYGGRCQVCHKQIPRRNGEPYFEAVFLVSRTKAEWIDRPGNNLCLCPNHSAMFHHSSVEMEPDILEQLRNPRKSNEDRPGFVMTVKLAGKEEEIYFTQDHFTELKALAGIDKRKDNKE
jgi:hypothetical protein